MSRFLLRNCSGSRQVPPSLITKLKELRYEQFIPMGEEGLKEEVHFKRKLNDEDRFHLIVTADLRSYYFKLHRDFGMPHKADTGSLEVKSELKKIQKQYLPVYRRKNNNP